MPKGSKSLTIDKTYTSLQLIGGNDCKPGVMNQCVDLLVQGGALIKKTLCIGGNLDVSGIITGELCGNILTTTITEKEPDEGIQVFGNVIPGVDDMYSLGTLDNKWANIFTQDLVVCGTLFANSAIEMMDGNLVIANIVCINEELQTNLIVPKQGNQVCIDGNLNMKDQNIENVKSMTANIVCANERVQTSILQAKQSANISVQSGLDMNCGIISNVEAIIVNNIFSKGLDVGYNTLNDVVAFQSPCIVSFSTSGGGDRNQFWGYKSGYSADGTANNNVSMGYHTLRNLTDGYDQVVIGSYAGASITTGSENVAIGTGALQNATFLFGTVAIGHNALQSTVTGARRSVAIGYFAAQNDTSSRDSVMIGSEVCRYTQDMKYSVIIGAGAGYYSGTTSNANYNVAIGSSAFSSNQEGSNCIAIGNYSMKGPSGGLSYSSDNIGIGTLTLSYQVGRYNIGIGMNALQSNGTGAYNLGREAFDNIAIGNKSMRFTTSGANNNIAIGKYSLRATNVNELEGSYNVAIGHNTMITAVLARENVAIGSNAAASIVNAEFNVAVGSNAFKSTTSGRYNVVVGYNALSSQTTGRYNTIVGGYAARNSTQLRYSVAVGMGALANSANIFGAEHVAVGNNAMARNQQGYGCVALGSYAIRGPLAATSYAAYCFGGGREALAYATGRYNIGIGPAALKCEGPGSANTGTSNYYNVAIGRRSMQFSGSGADNNIAIGDLSMQGSYGSLVTGSYNVCLGQYAGRLLTSGSENIVIGRYTTVSASDNTQIVIGKSATSSASRTVSIGEYSSSSYRGVAIGVSTSASGNSSIAIGFNASASSAFHVQLGQSTNSGTDALMKFRSQIIADESWIDGNSSIAIINDTGDIQKDASGNVCLAANLLILKDIPVSDPGVPGALWNDSGTLKISL